MTRRIREMKRLGMVITFGLLVAAVATELRRPAGQRTWQDRVAGVVPYDLRPPSPRRLRDTLWSPANERLFVPHAFGVGWTVNLGYLTRRVREVRDSRRNR